MGENVPYMRLDVIPADGCNPTFDQDGRLKLAPELERVVEERVNAGIAQFAADLVAAVKMSDLALAHALEGLLQWPRPRFTCAGCGGAMTVDAQNTCHCPSGCEFGDRYELMRGPWSNSPEDARPLPQRGLVYKGLIPSSQMKHAAGFCNTCNGTGFDFYTHCPCPDCSQPKPTPEQLAREICEVQPIPEDTFKPAPRSICCQAETFEADGRRVCSKCRLTRPL